LYMEGISAYLDLRWLLEVPLLLPFLFTARRAVTSACTDGGEMEGLVLVGSLLGKTVATVTPVLPTEQGLDTGGLGGGVVSWLQFSNERGFCDNEFGLDTGVVVPCLGGILNSGASSGKFCSFPSAACISCCFLATCCFLAFSFTLERTSFALFCHLFIRFNKHSRAVPSVKFIGSECSDANKVVMADKVGLFERWQAEHKYLSLVSGFPDFRARHEMWYQSRQRSHCTMYPDDGWRQ